MIIYDKCILCHNAKNTSIAIACHSQLLSSPILGGLKLRRLDIFIERNANVHFRPPPPPDVARQRGKPGMRIDASDARVALSVKS